MRSPRTGLPQAGESITRVTAPQGQRVWDGWDNPSAQWSDRTQEQLQQAEAAGTTGSHATQTLLTLRERLLS